MGNERRRQIRSDWYVLFKAGLNLSVIAKVEQHPRATLQVSSRRTIKQAEIRRVGRPRQASQRDLRCLERIVLQRQPPSGGS